MKKLMGLLVGVFYLMSTPMFADPAPGSNGNESPAAMMKQEKASKDEKKEHHKRHHKKHPKHQDEN